MSVRRFSLVLRGATGLYVPPDFDAEHGDCIPFQGVAVFVDSRSRQVTPSRPDSPVVEFLRIEATEIRLLTSEEAWRWVTDSEPAPSVALVR